MGRVQGVVTGIPLEMNKKRGAGAALSMSPLGTLQWSCSPGAIQCGHREFTVEGLIADICDDAVTEMLQWGHREFTVAVRVNDFETAAG